MGESEYLGVSSVLADLPLSRSQVWGKDNDNRVHVAAEEF